MYTGLKHAHSFMAYLVIAGVLIAFINALIGYSRNKPFQDKDRKISLLGLIPVHLQWLLGVVLYFISPLGIAAANEGFMKETSLRFYVLEHPLTMILAVVLITIGFSRAKRLQEDVRKFKTITLLYGIGLFMILLRIPWNVWPL